MLVLETEAPAVDARVGLGDCKLASMPNLPFSHLAIRFLRNSPLPLRLWDSDTKLTHYALSVLSSLDSSQNFDYVASLTFSATVELSGLPQQHYVVFSGQDVHKLLRLFPALRKPRRVLSDLDCSEHNDWCETITPAHQSTSSSSTATSASIASPSSTRSHSRSGSVTATRPTSPTTAEQPTALPTTDATDGGFIESKRTARSSSTLQPEPIAVSNKFDALDSDQESDTADSVSQTGDCNALDDEDPAQSDKPCTVTTDTIEQMASDSRDVISTLNAISSQVLLIQQRFDSQHFAR
jgi:hypothetical protein